jgi:hypothetical protein
MAATFETKFRFSPAKENAMRKRLPLIEQKRWVFVSRP